MDSDLCQNVNQTAYKKNCLLKYITVPFHTPPMYHRHQNMWQVPKIAKIIGEFGYNVDVIDYDDEQVQLNKKYDLLIDIFPQQNQVYQDFLADDCLKVLYSTGASPSWQNSQHLARVEALNARRHTALRPKAYVTPFNKEIGQFDAMFLIGNQIALDTYENLKIKKIFFIKNSAYQFTNLDLSKKSPNTFLYFATYPQVLKGLDLLLEVFARNQNISLVIASLFKQEQDFCTIYEQELYRYPNILAIGPLDITTNMFKKIIQICSYTVLPSCSEGMSGSVLTAMSAGLIPIVSRECGFHDDEVFHFKDCSIECISETLAYFSTKNSNWINSHALKSQEIIRQKYTPEHFCESFRAAMHGLLGG